MRRPPLVPAEQPDPVRRWLCDIPILADERVEGGDTGTVGCLKAAAGGGPS